MAIITIRVKNLTLRIPRSNPTLRAIRATRPLVFMRIPIAKQKFQSFLVRSRVTKNVGKNLAHDPINNIAIQLPHTDHVSSEPIAVFRPLSAKYSGRRTSTMNNWSCGANLLLYSFSRGTMMPTINPPKKE